MRCIKGFQSMKKILFSLFSFLQIRADARVNAANQAIEREQERQRHSQNMYFEDARNPPPPQQETPHHMQNNYRVCY